MGIVLWTIVNALMKFMPEFATQLPLPIYNFFYFITINPTPDIPGELNFPEHTPMSNWIESLNALFEFRLYKNALLYVNTIIIRFNIIKPNAGSIL